MGVRGSEKLHVWILRPLSQRFGALFDGPEAAGPAAMKSLLPVDGSATSVAAVQEVARCPLPSGSTVELPYAIHSHLPVIPDFLPWFVTIAGASA